MTFGEHDLGPWADVNSLLEAAAKGAAGDDGAAQFVSDMQEKYDDYGEDAFCSEAQARWLFSLAARSKAIRKPSNGARGTTRGTWRGR